MVVARLRRGAGSRVHGGRQSVELDWSGAVLSSRSAAGRIASGADRVAGNVQRGDCGVDPAGRRKRPVAIGRQLRIHRSFGRLDVSFICALGLGWGLAGSTRRQRRLGLRLSGCRRRGRHTGVGRSYRSFDCLDSGSPPWKVRRGRNAVGDSGPQRGAGSVCLLSNLAGMDWPEWQRQPAAERGHCRRRGAGGGEHYAFRRGRGAGGRGPDPHAFRQARCFALRERLDRRPGGEQRCVRIRRSRFRGCDGGHCRSAGDVFGGVARRTSGSG